MAKLPSQNHRVTSPDASGMLWGYTYDRSGCDIQVSKIKEAGQLYTWIRAINRYGHRILCDHLPHAFDVPPKGSQQLSQQKLRNSFGNDEIPNICSSVSNRNPQLTHQ